MLAGRKWAIAFAVVMIAALVLSACAPQAAPTATPKAAAQPTVIKIGVISPLTGNLGATGQDIKTAVDYLAELINGKYDIDFPLMKEEGIPGLGGAKIELIWGDSRGDPTQGMAEAERLITQEKVVAMIGAYNSAVAKTASVVTERYKIPYVCSDVTSPALTERGFEYFFRVIPHDGMQTYNAWVAMNDINKKENGSIKTAAIMWENTEWGSSVGVICRKAAEEFGIKIVEDIGYSAKATDLTSEIMRVKNANPDAVLTASYLTDAILLTKGFKAMDVNPKHWFGMAGFIEPDYLPAVGLDGEYIWGRVVYAPDLMSSKPYLVKINEGYKAKYGHDISISAAEPLDALNVICNALNRAGSTDSAKLLAAVKATDMAANEVINGYKGVKFNPQSHDNLLGNSVYVQIQQQKYRLAWPFDVAAVPYLPFKPWKQR